AILRTREANFIVVATTLICLFLGIYAIQHLPFIDFRAYRVGNTIPQQMTPEEQPIIEYSFEKDGKEVKSSFPAELPVSGTLRE
ncbi:MAG: hypothetical protein ACK5XL_17705, partial [Cyclobacteriaceae bacterium]